MAREYEPHAVALHLTYLRNRHRACESYHCNNRQTERKFVADHLCARTESTDKGELVVGRPSGEQYAEHSYRADSQQEEDADIEVDNLQSATPWEHRKTEHRGQNHQIRRQGKQEFVDMVERDKLLDKDLEHVGYRLQQAHRTDTVRT